MSKPFRMIAWNTERFNNLKAATEEAIRLGQKTIRVDLDRHHRGAQFDIEEAVETLDHIGQDFAASPMPTYPENREGIEP